LDAVYLPLLPFVELLSTVPVPVASPFVPVPIVTSEFVPPVIPEFNEPVPDVAAFGPPMLLLPGSVGPDVGAAP
jgi:hypothetical protein